MIGNSLPVAFTNDTKHDRFLDARSTKRSGVKGKYRDPCTVQSNSVVVIELAYRTC